MEQETTLPERSQRLMQCLVSEDKFELIQVERSLTVEKCLSAPLLVNQKQNEPELIKSIFLIVKRFNDLVNVGKKMNEDQMIALSADLFERFGGESLEDVMLFFKMARSGEFGDLYRLDSIVVLSWVDKYLDLKITAREDEIQNERNIRQREEDEAVKNHVPDEKAKQYLEQLSKSIKVTAISRNTGVLREGNPLFDYKAYIETLPEAAKNMDDEHLETMIDNTSKYSHPEVYEILVIEQESRKHQPKTTKKQKK
ncbi:MAG: hypothetical protein RSA74_13295 [Chryseobacterium sp.]